MKEGLFMGHNFLLQHKKYRASCNPAILSPVLRATVDSLSEINELIQDLQDSKFSKLKISIQFHQYGTLIESLKEAFTKIREDSYKIIGDVIEAEFSLDSNEI